jgi:hypothetical protein
MKELVEQRPVIAIIFDKEDLHGMWSVMGGVVSASVCGLGVFA